MINAREAEPHASQKAVSNALEGAGLRELGRFSLGKGGRHHVWSLLEGDACGGEDIRAAYEADQPGQSTFWGRKKY